MKKHNYYRHGETLIKITGDGAVTEGERKGSGQLI
jgi:hypothetical protein